MARGSAQAVRKLTDDLTTDILDQAPAELGRSARDDHVGGIGGIGVGQAARSAILQGDRPSRTFTIPANSSPLADVLLILATEWVAQWSAGRVYSGGWDELDVAVVDEDFPAGVMHVPMVRFA